MKVLIAMDSFKGNLSSSGAADIVEKGLRRVYGSATVDKVAIADGGEGTVEAIANSLNGEYVFATVTNPVGDKVQARYSIVNGNTAIFEMAEASGLCLVTEGKRNPLKTSTYGTGEMIKDALNKGCRKIIMGIGGSATNDGGMGMAAALGAQFLDIDGKSLDMGGGALDKLHTIDLRNIDPRIKETDFIVACDVSNPLYGEKGASRVFGPQKGATPQMADILDRNLQHFADIIKKDLSVDVANVPGSGAAGGLGAGLMAFCNAVLSKGIDIVLDSVNIDERIKDVDIVITGEGRVDGQTIYGKVPAGIAARAKKYNKPVFVIAGFMDKGAELVYQHGVDAVMSSMVGPLSLEDAIRESPRLIEEASERLFRIIKAVSKD